MKIGFRKPSIKKRASARTTGALKRKVKRAFNPLYGKKGMGWIKSPRRAAYNKIYRKSTFGCMLFILLLPYYLIKSLIMKIR